MKQKTGVQEEILEAWSTHVRTCSKDENGGFVFVHRGRSEEMCANGAVDVKHHEESTTLAIVRETTRNFGSWVVPLIRISSCDRCFKVHKRRWHDSVRLYRRLFF